MNKLKDKLDKCISITEECLEEAEAVDEKGEELMEFIQNYYKDSKYYRDQGKTATSLESISYAHGILDAGVLMKHIKILDYVLNEDD